MARRNRGSRRAGWGRPRSDRRNFSGGGGGGGGSSSRFNRESFALFRQREEILLRAGMFALIYLVEQGALPASSIPPEPVSARSRELHIRERYERMRDRDDADDYEERMRIMRGDDLGRNRRRWERRCWGYRDAVEGWRRMWERREWAYSYAVEGDGGMLERNQWTFSNAMSQMREWGYVGAVEGEREGERRERRDMGSDAVEGEGGYHGNHEEEGGRQETRVCAVEGEEPRKERRYSDHPNAVEERRDRLERRESGDRYDVQEEGELRSNGKRKRCGRSDQMEKEARDRIDDFGLRVSSSRTRKGIQGGGVSFVGDGNDRMSYKSGEVRADDRMKVHAFVGERGVENGNGGLQVVQRSVRMEGNGGSSFNNGETQIAYNIGLDKAASEGALEGVGNVRMSPCDDVKGKCLCQEEILGSLEQSVDVSKAIQSQLPEKMIEKIPMDEDMANKCVADQDKPIHGASSPKSAPELNITEERNNELQPTTFKVCDLNLLPPPDTNENQADLVPDHFHFPIPVCDASEDLPLGFGCMTGNAPNYTHRNCALSGGRMVQLTYLEEDSAMESNAYDSLEPM